MNISGKTKQNKIPQKHQQQNITKIKPKQTKKSNKNDNNQIKEQCSFHKIYSEIASTSLCHFTTNAGLSR